MGLLYEEMFHQKFALARFKNKEVLDLNLLPLKKKDILLRPHCYVFPALKFDDFETKCCVELIQDSYFLISHNR
jgi:hypothetical protein